MSGKAGSEGAAMVCPDCGATGQTESFCAGCGAFLGWGQAGEPKAAAPSPAPGPAPAPSPTLPATDLTRIAEFSARETEEIPSGPEVLARAERARALLVPVAQSSAAPAPEPDAGPVLPGRSDGPRPRRVRHLTAEEEPPGGIACPWCSTVNPESRNFCRRCAMFLTVTGQPERLPWWRRMFRRDGGRVPMAGERPLVRGLRARWPLWTMRAVLAGALVTSLVLWTGPMVNAVQDHFTQPVPIRPQSVTASAADPAHGPDALNDGYTNTWWGDGMAGSGAGQYLMFTFGQPVHLLDLMITPGAGTERDAYFSQARPLALDIVLFHANGTTTVSRITLDDTPGPQSFPLRGTDVQQVRLILRSAYGASSATEVAISEVEFFGRSASGAKS